MESPEQTVPTPTGSRIELVFEEHSYSVVPGGKTTIPVVLINRGLEEDFFKLSVEGVPSGWITSSSPVTQMAPGAQREIQFTIQPPRSPRSTAGRHTLKVRVGSQKAPGQVAETEITLTVAAFTEFSTELQPQRITAGQTARISVKNQSNIRAAFTISWQSQDDSLRFDPVNTQQMQTPAGEAGTAEFRASPVLRPWLGGEVTYPYTVQVKAAEGQTKNLTGAVVSRGLVPFWVLPVLFIMCLAAFFAIAIYTNRDAADIAGATQTAEAQIAQLVSVTQTASANQTQAVMIGEEDTDGDGLTNNRELELGTNPASPDSDGDELLDGDEINRGTDPLNTDTDADGLSDGEEVLRQGTDPLNPDTDNDKLLDGDEVNRGTDPLNPDSDGDTLIDGDEVALGLDPTNPDTDSDQLSDGEESPPCPDPKNPDTDGDGIVDGQDLDPCDPLNPSVTATVLAGATPTELTPEATAEPTASPDSISHHSRRPAAAARLYCLRIQPGGQPGNLRPERERLGPGPVDHQCWA